MIGDLTQLPGRDGKPLIREALKPALSREAALKKINMEKIGDLFGKEVYLVDEDAVRKYISDDFTCGANDEADADFVSKGHFWIGRRSDKADQVGVFLHEIVEWLQMHFGKKKYEDAHEHANSVEAVARALLSGRKAIEMDHTNGG